MNDIRPVGFLSPLGDYIPCSVYDHIFMAREICEHNHWNYIHADDTLLEHGYAHLTISFLGKKEYHVFWQHFLTIEQKNWLKPLFEAEEDGNIIPISRSTRCAFENEND